MGKQPVAFASSRMETNGSRRSIPVLSACRRNRDCPAGNVSALGNLRNILRKDLGKGSSLSPHGMTSGASGAEFSTRSEGESDRAALSDGMPPPSLDCIFAFVAMINWNSIQRPRMHTFASKSNLSALGECFPPEKRIDTEVASDIARHLPCRVKLSHSPKCRRIQSVTSFPKCGSNAEGISLCACSAVTRTRIRVIIPVRVGRI
jgi:hypothetical protein